LKKKKENAKISDNYMFRVFTRQKSISGANLQEKAIFEANIQTL